MATKTVLSTSFTVTLDAVEETVVVISNLNPKDAYGMVAKIVVTGGPVKFNAQGAAAVNGRDVTDDTIYLTLFGNRFNCIPTAITDSIAVDL